MDLFGLVKSVFVLGFTLLSLGGLAEITYDLAVASVEHQQISLGQWNRALYGERIKELPHHRKTKPPGKGALNKLLRDLG